MCWHVVGEAEPVQRRRHAARRADDIPSQRIVIENISSAVRPTALSTLSRCCLCLCATAWALTRGLSRYPCAFLREDPTDSRDVLASPSWEKRAASGLFRLTGAAWAAQVYFHVLRMEFATDVIFRDATKTFGAS